MSAPQASLSGLRSGRLRHQGAPGQGWVKCQAFGPVAPSPGRLMHSGGCHPRYPQLPLVEASFTWTWYCLEGPKEAGAGGGGHVGPPCCPESGEIWHVVCTPKLVSLWHLGGVLEIYFHSFHRLSSKKKQRKHLLCVVRWLSWHNLNVRLDTTTLSMETGTVSITRKESEDEHPNRREIVLIIILPFTFLGAHRGSFYEFILKMPLVNVTICVCGHYWKGWSVTNSSFHWVWGFLKP